MAFRVLLLAISGIGMLFMEVKKVFFKTIRRVCTLTTMPLIAFSSNVNESY